MTNGRGFIGFSNTSLRIHTTRNTSSSMPCYKRDPFKAFHFSLTNSITQQRKSLKVVQSVWTNRLCFECSADTFWSPWSAVVVVAQPRLDGPRTRFRRRPCRARSGFNGFFSYSGLVSRNYFAETRHYFGTLEHYFATKINKFGTTAKIGFSKAFGCKV